MGRRRLLNDQQLEEARLLRRQGFTRAEIAEKFDVGQTTIWDNIYSTKKHPIKIRVSRGMRYRDIAIVIKAICLFKKKEYTSIEVSRELEIPLEEVNHVWGHFS